MIELVFLIKVEKTFYKDVHHLKLCTLKLFIIVSSCTILDIEISFSNLLFLIGSTLTYTCLALRKV